MKKILTLLFALLPSKLANLFLLLLGHKISWKARIGFSFLYTNKLVIKEKARIGHFNFIKVDAVNLESHAIIRNLNILKGPFSMDMEKNSVIGKKNKFTRGYKPISYGRSSLKLGEGTRVTYDNFFDLTRSVSFGANSQVAGKGSQFWTHGYVHAETGSERIRVDGKITIGDNVYVGTSCVFNPGVTVGSSINIGGNAVVSKDLTKPGMYVSQPLRYIETDIDKTRAKLTRVQEEGLIEEVYTKENEETN